MTNDLGNDPGTSATLRGAILIVAAGLALGALYNSIGLASHPKHGLAWVKHAEEVASLESLQPATPAAGADSVARAAAPPSGASIVSPGASVASPGASVVSPGGGPVRSGANGSGAPSPSTVASPSGAPGHAGSTVPNPAVRPAPTGTGPAPGGSAPASTAAPAPANAPTAPGAAAPAAPAAELPVIPDLGKPIKLQMTMLKQLYDAGAVLVVDAREADEYAEGHIVGALSLPYNDALAEPERMQRMGEAGRPIVVYCSGGACEASMDLARLMIENGRKRVLVYEGGFPEWQRAGYPVATGASAGGR